MSTLCEIRVPTFRRPAWLRRALTSLQAQTHERWIALVFDDSPAAEADAVVRELDDKRIQYRPNARNLGAAANLDQAFAPGALVGGTFACVLEDDNWLAPSFLAENLRALEAAGLGLLLRNQQVWRQAGETFAATNRTTRGEWFSEGRCEPLALHARMFFNEGISNGGLFWRTGTKSALQVGRSVTITGVQEYCRTFGIREPLWFAREPLAVWAEVEAAAVTRGTHANRTFARAVQQLRIELVRRHGRAIVTEARRLGAERGIAPAFADLTLLQHLRHGLPPTAAALKAGVRHLTMPNPLAEFLAASSP